ncbi:MAG TPA: hypothetical protein VFO94_15785 [Gammaproteobacteria bacterium]|nr:hypothetical protein [Gammaproteobacteria bacterium]
MAALARLAAVLAAAAVLGGCARDHTLRCEPSERYARAGSTAPVRVPDDLTPPDETDALQLPSAPSAPAADGAEKACLETPPTFTPGGRGRGAAPPAGGDREIDN